MLHRRHTPHRTSLVAERTNRTTLKSRISTTEGFRSHIQSQPSYISVWPSRDGRACVERAADPLHCAGIYPNRSAILRTPSVRPGRIQFSSSEAIGGRPSRLPSSGGGDRSGRNKSSGIGFALAACRRRSLCSPEHATGGALSTSSGAGLDRLRCGIVRCRRLCGLRCGR